MFSRLTPLKQYYLDLLATGLLAGFAIVFFWKALFIPESYTPAGGGDLAYFIYPYYHFAAENLKQGVIPLWNPYLYGGIPFAADIQAGLFYPINLAYFLLAPQITYKSVELLAIFHIFLAGVFMYLMMRGLRESQSRPISRFSALAAATAYMFSDGFIVHLGNLNMVAVITWLPLIFLFLHRALTQRRLSLAAWGGITLGVAFLAGHLQTFLYILFALTVYFIFRLWSALDEGRGWKGAIPLVAAFALFVTVGFGVAAVQALPSYELSRQSIRADLDYQRSTEYSLPPAQLISLFIPSFFGRGPQDYWGPWLRTETGYIGVFPLIMALTAVVLRRRRLTYFFLGLAVIALLAALGGYTILHGWLYQLIPGFNKVRAPARLIFVFDFSVAALAGLGMETVLHSLTRWQRKALSLMQRYLSWVLVAMTLILVPLAFITSGLTTDAKVLMRLQGIKNGSLVFLILITASLMLLWARRRHWLRPRLWGTMALALIALELIGSGFNVDVGNTNFLNGFHRDKIINFLRRDPEVFRIDSVTEVWDVWQPNSTLLHNLFDVMGGYNPLLLADYDRYWGGLGSRSTPLYDLLNVKYIIGHKNVPLDWNKWVLAFDEDPEINVYRNINVLPRAFIVHQARVEPDRNKLFQRIHQPDFNPTQIVLLESGEELSLTASSPAKAKIIRYLPNELVVKTEAQEPGYLLLSEVYFDGWQAFVDGRREMVRRANYIFRAVAVPAGEHEVKLLYEPLSWKRGLTISAITWALLTLGAFFWLARRFTLLAKGGSPYPSKPQG